MKTLIDFIFLALRQRGVSIATVIIGCVMVFSNATATDIIYLTATGNSHVDTPALQSAVDAVPPGGVLHLSGHFIIHEEIYSQGFDGTIQGDGIDATVIEAVRQTDGTEFKSVFPNDPTMALITGGEPRTSIFFFERSNSTNIQISDMTLMCLDPSPCDPRTLWGHSGIQNIAAFISDFLGDGTSTVIERVAMIAVPGDNPYVTQNVSCGILTLRGGFHINPDGTGRERIPGAGAFIMADCETYGLDYSLSGQLYDKPSDYPFIVEGLYSSGCSSYALWLHKLNCPKEILNCEFADLNMGPLLIRLSGPTVIRENLFENVSKVGIQIKECSNARLEENMFNNVGKVGIHVEASPDTRLLENTIINFSEFGIRIKNMVGIRIERNAFQNYIGTKFWPVSLLVHSNVFDAVVTENQFINLGNVPKGAILVRGSNLHNSFVKNDYKESGLSGIGNPGGKPCVILLPGAENNLVFESTGFPSGTNAKTQVLDNNSPTTNRVVGHSANEIARQESLNPGIGQLLIDLEPEE